MDIPVAPDAADDTAARVGALVPWMQQRAAQLDLTATFPEDEIGALRDTGALTMALPVQQRVRTRSIMHPLADRLADVLVQIGTGNLAVGRIVEAHVNARQLIARYGSPSQQAAADTDLRQGHLFALWVTDPPEGGLRMTIGSTGIQVTGRKMMCSAAGYATRAVITAATEGGGRQMLIVPLHAGERVEKLPSPLQGMRAAVTGAVDFTGCALPMDACLGNEADYLREPDFSAGAWRGSAIAVGGLRGLLDLTKAQLAAANRLADPHQLQRLGQTMIACETGQLWVRRAARMAESGDAPAAEIVAYIGLARIAVETACLDAMRLVQRSLGLSAFRCGNPIERICRDLGTYLRQPAPDEVLTEAAAYFARPQVAAR